MVRTSQSIRVLGPSDVAAALEVIGTDPVVNVFADYRTRITQLDPRWLGGEMWGCFEGDRLASMCHVGANLVPVNATPEACDAFVDRAVRTGPRSSTIVGPHDAVALLWAGLEEHWPTPRDFRWDQPHLVATGGPRRCRATRWCGVRPRTRWTCSTRPAWRCTPRRSASAPSSTAAATSTARASTSWSAAAGRSPGSRAAAWCSRPRWRARRRAPARSRGCTSTRSCAAGTVHGRHGDGGRHLPARDRPGGVALRQRATTRAARAAYERAGFEQTGTFATIMF